MRAVLDAHWGTSPLVRLPTHLPFRERKRSEQQRRFAGRRDLEEPRRVLLDFFVRACARASFFVADFLAVLPRDPLMLSLWHGQPYSFCCCRKGALAMMLFEEEWMTLKQILRAERDANGN